MMPAHACQNMLSFADGSSIACALNLGATVLPAAVLIGPHKNAGNCMKFLLGATTPLLPSAVIASHHSCKATRTGSIRLSALFAPATRNLRRTIQSSRSQPGNGSTAAQTAPAGRSHNGDDFYRPSFCGSFRPSLCGSMDRPSITIGEQRERYERKFGAPCRAISCAG